MKTTLIFPPQWSPNLPPLSLPLLSAYLKANGFNVQQRDLNIETYDIFLSPEYLAKIREIITGKLLRLEQKEKLSPDEQREYYQLFRARLIDRYWGDEIQEARETQRDPEIFFNFQSYKRSRLVMEAVLHMVSAAYFPMRISLSTFHTERCFQSAADFLEATQNEAENPFINFYKEYFLEQLLQEPPDLIGISIIGMSQVLPGLTLARLIKSAHPETHVVIGGSVFTETINQLKECPELFGPIFDSVIIYEGEIPLRELCRCLTEGGNLNSVPNLVYKEEGRVKTNEICIPEKAESLPTPCFDGLPLDSYFSPYLILPLLSSRGCYWGQCAFCSHGTVYNNRYRRRPPELVIEDLHTLTQRHRAKFFTFNDEAIFPAHLQSLSEAILASGIAIESTTDLRLDPQITPELAQMASDAGFKVFFFGLESGSDRVLAHMKKGADLATARQVFQNCSDAGVWNHAFVFFGFPTETLEEARATMDFVFENKDIIHSVGHSTFQLGRCSPAMKNPELFGITAIHKDSSSFMNLWANYSVASGLTMGQAEEVTREFADRVEKEYRSYFIWSRLAKDHILLYLSHYNTLKLSEVLEKFQDPEQPSHQGDLSETGFPELKSTVLCGLTKFDVARIMINMGTSEELAQNRDNLFIMYNFESGKTISVTLTAGLILGRCNGRRTIRDIAVELAELFQIPLEQATEDCKRIISAALEAGMCIQYQRYEF